MRARTILYAILDLLSVTLVFSLFLYSRPGSFLTEVSRYFYSFLIFLAIWFIVSLLGNKYSVHKEINLGPILRQILLTNLFIVGIASTMMYLVRIDYFSRTVVFGTILVVTFIELIWGTLDYHIRTAVVEPPEMDTTKVGRRRQLLKEVLVPKRVRRKDPATKAREEAILVEIKKDAFDFVFHYAPIESPETLVVSTTSRFNIEMQQQGTFKAIVNLKRLNDVRYVNKFFETANHKLEMGGLYIDYVETKNLRKERILRKYPPLINYIAYSLDFLIKRVFPKFMLTKKIYFFLTRGQNRVFTKAEIFGRLYSCGFEVQVEQEVDNHLFFVARKIKEPSYPANPTYGPFVKLQRIGYKGKMIRVYKLRTMHPYAEYLQEYIYMKQGLEKGGKFKSDFRVSTLGKFLRTFWLDELPMIINLLKREMKIVGVRPLSKHYFSLYSGEMQERRIHYKPGLIPPYYADMPQTLEEIQASELKYMDAYDKHPFFTDFAYFFKAVFNIIFRQYRSQ